MSMHHGSSFEYILVNEFSAWILPWILHGHFNPGFLTLYPKPNEIISAIFLEKET